MPRWYLLLLSACGWGGIAGLALSSWLYEPRVWHPVAWYESRYFVKDDRVLPISSEVPGDTTPDPGLTYAERREGTEVRAKVILERFVPLQRTNLGRTTRFGPPGPHEIARAGPQRSTAIEVMTFGAPLPPDVFQSRVLPLLADDVFAQSGDHAAANDVRAGGAPRPPAADNTRWVTMLERASWGLLLIGVLMALVRLGSVRFRRP